MSMAQRKNGRSYKKMKTIININLLLNIDVITIITYFLFFFNFILNHRHFKPDWRKVMKQLAADGKR